MTYDDLIQQISSVPDVHGSASRVKSVVLGAMGGSALAADALSFLNPEYAAIVHRDYGLPRHAPDQALYIAVSYSGNTEETLHFAHTALERGYRVGVVASGGLLLQFAKTHNLPYAEVQSGHVPRNAYLFLVRGLLGLLGEESLLLELSRVRPGEDALRETAEEDAHYLVHGVPLFYTSERNSVLGRLATLVMDESARTPAFRNTFPEMNHNELQAFDSDMPAGLMHLFRMVLIRDERDDPRVLRRMHIYEKLMRARNQSVRTIDLACDKPAEALVTLWMRLLFAARLLAETRNIDPDTQPLIDEFKTLL